MNRWQRQAVFGLWLIPSLQLLLVRRGTLTSSSPLRAFNAIWFPCRRRKKKKGRTLTWRSRCQSPRRGKSTSPVGRRAWRACRASGLWSWLGPRLRRSRAERWGPRLHQPPLGRASSSVWNHVLFSSSDCCVMFFCCWHLKLQLPFFKKMVVHLYLYGTTPRIFLHAVFKWCA